MDRPFVYVNMAMTADGKITSAAREYPRFTSDADREHMDRLRAEADAILVGAGTIRADDPSLGVRAESMQAYRRSLGKPDPLARVVVSSRLDLDPGLRFFTEGTPERIVATVEDADAAAARRLEGRAEIWRVGRGRVDLASLLRRLRARGFERLLAEGGGELNWQLLRADLIDEIHVTVCPSLLGGRDAPTPFEGAGLAMREQRRLRLVDVRREGDELFCRWEILR